MVFESVFIWVGIIEMLCQFVQGVTGFGATVLGAAFITELVGTATGGPYGTLISHIILVGMAIPCLKSVSWKDLVKIILIVGPFEAVGAYFGYRIPESAIKIIIGGSVSFIAALNIYKIFIKTAIAKKKGETYDPDREPMTVGKKIFQYVCLVVGGLVNGAYTVGGPLITVYVLDATKEKERFRDTIVWVWVIMNSILVIPQQYMKGLYTPRLLSLIAVTLIPSIIGVVLGMKFMKKIDREIFLKIVYVLLLIVGGNMLIRALLAL